MIKSMTGYGRSSFVEKNNNIDIEIKSVNSRFFELKIRGYSFKLESEIKIRKYISSLLLRGNISMEITIDKGATSKLSYNKSRLDNILEIFKEIEQKYSLKLDISNLININDIMKKDDLEDISISKIKTNIKKSILVLNKMRKSEGSLIESDLKNRINFIIFNINKIEKKYSSNKKYHYKKLKNKIIELVDNIQIDENRLNQEIALIVEKTDITEEIVRTRSHTTQFMKYLKSNKPVGKRLNFLIQEIMREINTIGSKASLFEVTNIVIEIKNELEKIREQLQNIL